MKTRIMYIENKSGGLNGPARIGRVRFSKSGRPLYCGDQMFQSLTIRGFKANYFEAESGDEYWISGCKKQGGDGLYAGVIEIDDDVHDEYRMEIRGEPGRIHETIIRCPGKY